MCDIINNLKREDLHHNLLVALEKAIPNKTELAETLMDILFIEKGAIYRRLRGEVPIFNFEAVNIAEKLNISINSLIYPDSTQIDRFEITEYASINGESCSNYLSLIDLAKNDPQSEFIESASILPVSIFTGFNVLTKFYMFKYQYLFSGTESRISFNEFNYPDSYLRIFKSYFEGTKHFANTIQVWDYLIFKYLVTDLHFFSSINLISEDDMQLIKTDLLAFVDYIEQISINGYFKETGKSVSIYISDINFDANYLCVKFNDVRISHIKSFLLNSVQSFDKSSYRKMNDWIHSLKRSSTLITQSGAIYRADFFEKQWMIISEL